MDFLFGASSTSSSAATTSDRNPGGGGASHRGPDAALEDASGMEQRRLMMALHEERERLAKEQMAVDAKWDDAVVS